MKQSLQCTDMEILTALFPSVTGSAGSAHGCRAGQHPSAMRTATLGSFLNLRRGVLIEAVVADSDSGPTQPTYHRVHRDGSQSRSRLPSGLFNS